MSKSVTKEADAVFWTSTEPAESCGSYPTGLCHRSGHEALQASTGFRRRPRHRSPRGDAVTQWPPNAAGAALRRCRPGFRSALGCLHAPPRCRPPLIDHKLSVLRDEKTPSAGLFRQLVDELVCATRPPARCAPRRWRSTPVALAQCRRLADPRPIDADPARGPQELEGMTRLPTPEVFPGDEARRGHPGVETYASQSCPTISGRQCFVIDPMLATGKHPHGGHRLHLLERGARRRHHALCLIATPRSGR